MRLAVWTLMAATAMIASCGGGGDGGADPAPGGGVTNGGSVGGTTTLFVTLAYPNEGLSLFQQAQVQPQLGGFEGHAANCALRDGSLPPGLSLGGDCVVSGRPLQDGTFNFTVRVGAAGASNTLDVQAQLKVKGPLVQYPLRTFLQALPLGESVNDLPATANWTASPDLQANWTYRITSGTLPAGLSLDASSGRISGTPQESGSFNASIQSTLATQFGTYTPVVSSYDVNVNVAFIGYTGASNSSSAADPTQTVFISQPVTLQPVTIGAAAPGTTIGSVSLQGTLPAGITLDAATGVISGIPTGPTSGTVRYDVQATLSSGEASAPTQGLLMLAVVSPVTYSYAGGQTFAVNTPASLVPARTTSGSAPLSPTQSVIFQARAGDCTLPPGMALDPASGTVSGTPAASGAFSCAIDETITNNGVTWTISTFLAFNVL